RHRKENRIIHDPFFDTTLERHQNLCKLFAMPNASTYRVGLIQMSASPDAKENLASAVTYVEQAADQGADVICLPELFRSQYFCQREDAALFDLAEPVPGPTTEALGRAAKESGAVV